MRRGLLGGTFDPIHKGHLDVARAARSALALDEVVVIPSNVPPHRRLALASPRHRLAMARLATRGETGLTTSDFELQEDGPSYTSRTLDRLSAQGVDTRDLFFITGADAFRDIRHWKDFPRILDRCHFVAVSRPGCPAASLRQALPELAERMTEPPAAPEASPRIYLVEAPTAPVSSTEVRRRLAAGQPIDGLVPPAVADYIRTNALYRDVPSSERT
jgi:nicotinate-nucleotide adenylyltransferase